jgi:hypothetical protein
MSEEKKGLGSKFIGLFVEKEPTEAGSDGASSGELSDAEIAAIAGKAKPSGLPGDPGFANPMPGRPAAPPPMDPALEAKLGKASIAGAATDFDAVFREVIDASALDKMKKAEDLLKGLPDSIPLPQKKQIVETSLRAFGIEIEKIIDAAQQQRRALETFVRVSLDRRDKGNAEAETQIKTLNEKIQALKADTLKRTAAHDELATSAEGRKSQVQKVLEFFQSPQGEMPKP